MGAHGGSCCDVEDDLWFDCLEDGVYGCCVGDVYRVVFDAVDEVGGFDVEDVDFTGWVELEDAVDYVGADEAASSCYDGWAEGWLVCWWCHGLGGKTGCWGWWKEDGLIGV